MAGWSDVAELPMSGDNSLSQINTSTFNNSVPSANQKVNELANKVTIEGSDKSIKNIVNGVSKSDIYGNTDFSSGANLTYDETGTSLSSYENPQSEIWVKLQSAINPEDLVIFNVMPRVSENRAANYEEVKVVQHPGAMLKYTGSSVRTWSITDIKLVSRTPQEATKNLIALNKIRSWVMPYYGDGTFKDPKGAQMLGAPPDILYFSAYGTRNIEKTPVVLTNYGFDYPNDVTYIGCLEAAGIKKGTPFPIILTLTIEIKEAYSAQEYSNFNLFEYKTGNMAGAFGGDSSGSSTPPASEPETTVEAVKEQEQFAPPKVSSVAKDVPQPPNGVAGKAVAIVGMSNVEPKDQLWYDTETKKRLDVKDVDTKLGKVYTKDGKTYETAFKDVKHGGK